MNTLILSHSINLPNVVSLSRVFLLPFILYFMYQNNLKIAFALFILGALSDSLDGILARALKKESKFGAILDQMADKIFVISIFLMSAILQLIKGVDLIPVFIILTRDFVISGIRQYHTIKTDPLGKIKMNMQVCAIFFIFLSSLCHSLSGLDRLTLWAACVLTIVSFINYLRNV